MKKFVFGMLVFLIMVIIVIILIVSLSSEKKTSGENLKENLTINNDTFQTTPFELLNEEQQQSYLDCQEDINCFETRFHNCEQAYYTLEQGSLITKYEIIAYEQDLCKIKITVSNDFGDSGETTCLFDNKKSFSEVIENPSSCENINNLMLI